MPTLSVPDSTFFPTIWRFKLLSTCGQVLSLIIWKTIIVYAHPYMTVCVVNFLRTCRIVSWPTLLNKMLSSSLLSHTHTVSYKHAHQLQAYRTQASQYLNPRSFTYTSTHSKWHTCLADPHYNIWKPLSLVHTHKHIQASTPAVGSQDCPGSIAVGANRSL